MYQSSLDLPHIAFPRFARNESVTEKAAKSSAPQASAEQDADLLAVRAVLLGERERFAELVQRYEVRIRGFCQKMLHDHSSAQDAAQEVFVKAYVSLASFREDSKFSTWLYRVASNHCIDLIRRKRLIEFLSWDSITASRGQPATMTTLRGESVEGKTEARELLALILARLSPDYRSLIILREAFGLSYQELATALGGNVESVKARLKRARSKILAIEAELNQVRD